MKLFADKSLGFRMLTASILIIVVVLSIYTIFSVVSEWERAHGELESKGELLVNLLSYNSRVGVFAENKELLMSVAEGIIAEADVVFIAIYNSDMKKIYAVNRSPVDLDAEPDGEARRAAARLKQNEMQLKETQRTMEFTKAVVFKMYPNEEKTLYFGDKEAGAISRVIGYVRIGLSKESLNRKITAILMRNGITTLIFIAASVVVVILAVRKITKPLETLTRHVRALGKSDEVAQVPVETMDEIGRLAKAFNTMLDERKAADQAFQKILMDIHDGIGGITTNICLLSEVAQKAASSADVNNALATIWGLSREGMGEIRSLMCSLDRNDLSWNTLIAELRTRGTKTVEYHAMSFELSAEIGDTDIKPGSLLCLHLFRIYREALTNVVKHSKAKNVWVDFCVSRDRLHLDIRDDGQGFDHAIHSEKGRGVPNMKTRAAEIGGTVTITSGAGTCVSINIPLPIRSGSMAI